MLDYLISFLFGTYILFVVVNGCFLYNLCRGFVEIKKSRWAKFLLFITLMLSSGMVIWIGDNNLAMTLPFYLAGFLVATKGDLLGRITVGGVFFCFIMSVCAIADTFMIPSAHYDLYTRALRPLVFCAAYLLLRSRIKDTPIQLPHRLWKLCAGLTLLPTATLSVLILPPYWMPDSVPVHSLTLFQGLIILPLSLIASMILLFSILVLADYEQKAQAAALADMREVYYESLQREQTQVRTLRHDLRNHLHAALGLLESGETEKAQQYLFELADAQALRPSRRICENEIVNVILSSKCEDMARSQIEADIQVVLPAVLPIADTDICALLGNALDNAIEAAKSSEEKKIKIRCKAEKGLFMLCVKNSRSGEVHADLSTTKKDKALHGFGLAGMHEIAERYGGSMDAGPVDGIFELLVSIPIGQIDPPA